MSNHTQQTLREAALESALMEVQSRMERVDRMLHDLQREEAAEDADHARQVETLSRKAGCVPLTVYEDRRRDARQHDALTCARSETRAAWRVAHNACGGGS